LVQYARIAASSLHIRLKRSAEIFSASETPEEPP